MKYTIDRFNALREHYGLIPYLLPSDLWGEGGCHKYLDELDRCAGIHTAWSDGHECNSDWPCASDHRLANTVGARLALHEDHLRYKRRPYFWLGAEADWCDGKAA